MQIIVPCDFNCGILTKQTTPPPPHTNTVLLYNNTNKNKTITNVFSKFNIIIIHLIKINQIVISICLIRFIQIIVYPDGY